MRYAIGMAALCVVAAWPAGAQEPISQELKQAQTAREKTEGSWEGWHKRAAVGLTFSFNRSDHVVGNPDGTTLLLGFQGEGLGEYRRNQHRWVNEGRLIYAQTRSPVVPLFLKAADDLSLKSTYYYAPRSIPWVGPFARGSLASSIMPGELVVAEDGITTRVDGEAAQPLARLTQKRLTGAFEPLLLKEVVGGFLNPVDRGPKLRASFQLGVGAEEVFTRNGLAVNDDPATLGVIELMRLQSYTNAGVDLTFTATGTIGATALWTVNATVFQPVYTTADTTLSGFELLEVDANGKVSFKLAKWASFDLVGSAKRYPLIVEAWQTQVGGQLAITFNVL